MLQAGAQDWQYTEAQTTITRDMLASSLKPHTTFQGSNWSLDETADLMELWDKAEMLAGDRHSNPHVYERLSGCMWDFRHDWSACQCHIMVL